MRLFWSEDAADSSTLTTATFDANGTALEIPSGIETFSASQHIHTRAVAADAGSLVLWQVEDPTFPPAVTAIAVGPDGHASGAPTDLPRTRQYLSRMALAYGDGMALLAWLNSDGRGPLYVQSIAPTGVPDGYPLPISTSAGGSVFAAVATSDAVVVFLQLSVGASDQLFSLPLRCLR